MATSIKVLYRLDDPFKMKDCDKQVDLCINMAKHVQVSVKKKSVKCAESAFLLRLDSDITKC